jgi:SpoIIAA-like
MIELMTDLPAGVTGFEMSGKINAEDYRDVVLPAVLAAAAANGEVRFLIVIHSFTGMSGGALWQDLKMGFENLRTFKRTAVVTDLEWVHHMTGLFGWMTPGDTKTFTMADLEEACTWVAG